ncbi:MAG: hypothetical protein D6731_07755 [Planctomycetota bacterium]|nr:MAG: hypothetical protein D6731_07755 [Planctomycetota bacterium]
MKHTLPPPLLDPFEQELTLAEVPRVLSFAPRAVEIDLEDLVRSWSFDLVGAIPRPLGTVRESFTAPERGPIDYLCAAYQVGSSTLALATEITEPAARHRVLELLGVREDVRLRINLALLSPDAEDGLTRAARAEVEAGRPLGQVRVWGNDSPARGEARLHADRVLRNLGFDARLLDRTVREPTYVPPAGGRRVLTALPSDDLRAVDALLALLGLLPVEGVDRRAPRRVAAHTDRLRRKGSIVSYRYETHRAATGVLHLRRREVEAGVERPGLVRTFNLAGLRGGARLRIRDVGGRCSAEFAGTPDSVRVIAAALERQLGGRAG